MLFDDWTVADVCGVTSIACWLGAQLPQVIKNWQLQSCDGLALPFLINWLMGDFTNLIGCILTEQLPFQTYLATYFCFVDVALVAQYFYYQPKAVPSTPQSSFIIPGAPAVRTRSFIQTPTSPLPPTAGLPTRSNSGRGRRRTQPPPVGTHGLPHVPHHAHTISEPYPAAPADALYAAALDVARAAERVSHRRSGSGRPRPRHHATAPPSAGHDDAHPLIDSFHSDLSLPSSSTEDEEDYRRMTQSMGALDPRHDPRGRSLTRDSSILSLPHPESSDTVNELQDSGMLEVRRRGASRSRSRARTAHGPGRRAAGVAFMSLGMLLWKVSDTAQLTGGKGHVVVRDPGLISVGSATGADAGASSASPRAAPWQPAWQHPMPLGDVRSTWVTIANVTDGNGSKSKPVPNPGHDDEPLDFKMIVGRISAWCCTTLYLTSRLPQIWKNFKRKSVEGLSILLFLFAFLGNTFYVLSIVLAAPPPGEQGHYLLRALPYLLGSGGTLVFDLTIMIQAAIYGSAPPTTPLDPRHRRSYSYGALRRRRTHTEDGILSHAVSHAQGERRPLLSHSPVRSVTEPPSAWNTHATVKRSQSASSTASNGAGGGGLWLRTEGSPTQTSSNLL